MGRCTGLPVCAPMERDDPSAVLASLCDGVAQVAVGPVRSGLEPLDDVEHALAASMVNARRDEFLTGRWLARHLLDGCGMPAAPLRRGPHGAAMFPAGVAGSISHAGGWVVAVVAAGPRSIGVDLEPWSELEPALAARLRAPGETSDGDPLVRFAAKEALFKAVNPLDGQWREFDDVALDLTGGHVGVAWSAHLLPAPVRGRWAVGDGWVGALVWVP